MVVGWGLHSTEYNYRCHFDEGWKPSLDRIAGVLIQSDNTAVKMGNLKKIYLLLQMKIEELESVTIILSCNKCIMNPLHGRQR